MDTFNLTEILSLEFVATFGKMALWLQAIGIITLILLISNLISIFSTFLRRKREKIILDKLEEIEKKLDKINKNKR